VIDAELLERLDPLGGLLRVAVDSADSSSVFARRPAPGRSSMLLGELFNFTGPGRIAQSGTDLVVAEVRKYMYGLGLIDRSARYRLTG